MVSYSIGVDLGGTNLRAAAISRHRRDPRQDFGRHESARGRDAVLDDIVGSIVSLRERIGARDSPVSALASPASSRWTAAYRRLEQHA
jgi:predicted NBD/HSP70 family sugar kinase